MNIILTKHCLQRREYLEKRDENEILKWINFFIKKFNFQKKEDDIYIVKSKGNKVVLEKKKYKLIIITFIGFKDNLFEKKEAFDFKCYSEKKKFKNKIYRYNYIGRLVTCGSINHNIDETINVKFQNRMKNKFIISNEYEKLKFNSIDEIDFLILDNSKYILNIQFERKNN